MKIDFPDASFNGNNSLIIYFDDCNMKCNFCNYKKMQLLKNLKEVNLNDIKKFIIENIHYIDDIIITGGEPIINEHLLLNLLKLLSEFDKEIILYTNLLNISESIIFYSNKIIVDVKGNNVEEIIKNTKISKENALKLFDLYNKYKLCNKFIFRLKNYMNNEIGFKNVKYYTVESI